MFNYFIIYLCFGLILRIIGPMAKEINSEFMNNSWKRYFRVGLFRLSQKPPFGKILIMELLLSTAVIIFWPVFLVLFLLNMRNKQSNKIKNIQPEIKITAVPRAIKEKKDLYLYGVNSSAALGSGVLKCSACLYEENIFVSGHGRDANGDFLAYYGFQCQSCGNFHQLTDPDPDKIYLCECGGKLSKNEKVFCPKCHSFDVNYTSRIIY